MAKKLVSDNFGSGVLQIIKKKYAVYRGKSDLQAEMYAFLVKEGFSYREIAKVTGKTHEAVRHAVMSKRVTELPSERVRKETQSPVQSSSPKVDQYMSEVVGEQLGKKEARGKDKTEKNELVIAEEKKNEPVKIVPFVRKQKKKSPMQKVAESIDAIDKTLYGSVFSSLHKAREYLPARVLAEEGAMVDEEEEEIDEKTKSSIGSEFDSEPVNSTEGSRLNLEPTVEPTVFVWSGTAKELKNKIGKSKEEKLLQQVVPASPAGRDESTSAYASADRHVRERVPRIDEERVVPVIVAPKLTPAQPEPTLIERLNPEPKRKKEDVGSSALADIPINGVPERKTVDQEPAKTVGAIPHLVLDTFNKKEPHKGVSFHKEDRSLPSRGRFRLVSETRSR